MVNCTNPMECVYNITALTNTNPLNDPTTWVKTVDGFASGWLVITLLIIIGLTVFLISKKTMGETQSLAFTGITMSITAVLLFLAETSSGEKLLSWTPVLIILLLTSIAIYFNSLQKNY